jgi:hypothetical protein
MPSPRNPERLGWCERNRTAEVVTFRRQIVNGAKHIFLMTRPEMDWYRDG